MAITFPVGFVFRPTDKEVIQHYLLKKQIEEELPLNGVIQERDVYSEEVLSEVFRSSKTHVYFFTQLKKKYLKGSNHDRTVGKATWRSESVDDIRLDENTIIGKKRVLDYINPGSVDHGDWNMKEFSLDGVLLEIPQTSSDYVVCLLEKKEQAIKRDRQKNMQSKKRTRGALENLPSGCFNYKRIKLPSKQNQQTENQQTESAPLVDEQAGLINGEAGVETLEQIMQYLLEPDSSMVDVDEENVEQMMQYLLQPDSPLDSMPPLIEAKPAPTVDEDGGHPSGENESSDYVVCLLEKKERAIKRDGQKNMQSKKNAPVNTPSGCFNNKRVKISSNQNQQTENQQTESASLVDEQVGLINGEAGVQTLEQIIQYLLEPDSSMVEVDVENVERMMQYLLEPDSPLDSMPPLMEAKPAPTVDGDGGYHSGENEVRMQPSIPDQSLPSSNPEYAVLDYIHSLASGQEVTAIENDVRILEQPSTNKRRRLLLVTSIPPPESLLADSPGHAILNSVIPSATPAPTVEPSYEVAVPRENGEQEIGMLPVEKSHWDYQPSIAAPESLTDDAIRNSIILLSTTVEGFAEDFIDPFLNGN